MRPTELKRHALLAAALIIGATAAAVALDVPVPTDFVADHAGILDGPAARQINNYLQELEQKTTAQVIVLTVLSLQGEPIENAARGLYNKWGLGQKSKDNGVLILVALKDKQYRIEVGRGLEGALPDGYVGQVSRDYFAANFRAKQYGPGLVEGTLVIVDKIAKEHGASISGMPQVTQPRAGRSTQAIVQLIFFIIMIIVFAGSRMFLFFGLPLGGGWGRGGGGFGGGGFGSFGGGGGGFSAGGGASGSW